MRQIDTNKSKTTHRYLFYVGLQKRTIKTKRYLELDDEKLACPDLNERYKKQHFISTQPITEHGYHISVQFSYLYSSQTGQELSFLSN